MSLCATSSQTVGPFFSIGLSWLYKDELFPDEGQPRVTIEGRVLDGDGLAISDAVLELWQADAHGRYPEPGNAATALSGFGRVATDPEGRFRFTTVRPGCVRAATGVPQAPHISVLVFMRGLLKPVRTRLYFAGDPRNASDPVLAYVPAARRHTLLAQPAGTTLHWNVRMQGSDETVFFEI